MSQLDELIEIIHDATPPAEDGGVPDVCNRWADHKAVAKAILSAGWVKTEAEHIVTFGETGYGLQHPVSCRPDLIGCVYNEWLAGQMAPDREPGQYLMTWTEGGDPAYERIE